ncbi:TPA: hypothetical protein ACS72N_001115 [Providencia alcalifaciens]
MSKIQDVIDDLTKRKKSISCNGSRGLLVILTTLGFEFKDGKTAGHKVFTHYNLSQISEFKTHSIDCGHKPGREMKFQYVQNTIRLLNQYKDELEAINEK